MTKKRRKGLLLNLPEDLFEIMKEYKLVSGMSYTNILYNSLVWWLAKKDLLDLSYIKLKSKELVEGDEKEQ